MPCPCIQKAEGYGAHLPPMSELQTDGAVVIQELRGTYPAQFPSQHRLLFANAFCLICRSSCGPACSQSIQALPRTKADPLRLS